LVVINLRKIENPEEAQSAWEHSSLDVLNMFINDKERCHTTDNALLAQKGNFIFKCKKHKIHNPRGPEQ